MDGRKAYVALFPHMNPVSRFAAPKEAKMQCETITRQKGNVPQNARKAANRPLLGVLFYTFYGARLLHLQCTLHIDVIARCDAYGASDGTEDCKRTQWEEKLMQRNKRKGAWEVGEHRL